MGDLLETILKTELKKLVTEHNSLVIRYNDATKAASRLEKDIKIMKYAIDELREIIGTENAD